MKNVRECSDWQDNDCISIEGNTKCLNWFEVKWWKKAQDKYEIGQDKE